MRRFSFVVSPLVKFPWEILMYLCAVGAIAGVVLRNIHAVLPALVGALIFFLFYSMKRFSYIFVSDRSIRVRLGVFASCELAHSQIRNVTIVEHRPIHGIGVKRVGKGETAIVTTTGKVVRLELGRKGSLKVFGFMTVNFEALRLSPEKQDEFVAMIQERISLGGNKS